MRKLLILIGLSFFLIAPSCDVKVCNNELTCDCYAVIEGVLTHIKCEPGPSPSPIPTETPSPDPIPSVSPSPEPSIPPSPIPTPSVSPSPEPSSSPIPDDCSQYKPFRTKWSLLTCTLNNKQTCGKPTDKVCGCNGDGCKFNIKQGESCSGDSTPIYFGEVPCWKSGNIEPCEYPPGSKCGEKTDWTSDPGVALSPESDGYGAKIKFPLKGSFKIKACRAGSKTLCTQKTANVS